MSSVFEYAMTNPTQQEVTTKGTLFGAYNAVTEYFQNVRVYKDGEAKLTSILFGTGLQRSQTAFNLCIEFARNRGGGLCAELAGVTASGYTFLSFDPLYSPENGPERAVFFRGFKCLLSEVDRCAMICNTDCYITLKGLLLTEGF